MNLAEVVQTEAEENSREELDELNFEELFNKSCVLKSAQMLVISMTQKSQGGALQPWRRLLRPPTGVVTRLSVYVRSLISS